MQRTIFNQCFRAAMLTSVQHNVGCNYIPNCTDLQTIPLVCQVKQTCLKRIELEPLFGPVRSSSKHFNIEVRTHIFVNTVKMLNPKPFSSRDMFTWFWICMSSSPLPSSSPVFILGQMYTSNDTSFVLRSMHALHELQKWMSLWLTS